MSLAIQLESQLLHAGLAVDSVVEIDYGQQICLRCGAVVNVYDSEKVLVQGKLPSRSVENSLAKLKQALPRESRWTVKIGKMAR